MPRPFFIRLSEKLGGFGLFLLDGLFDFLGLACQLGVFRARQEAVQATFKVDSAQSLGSNPHFERLTQRIRRQSYVTQINFKAALCSVFGVRDIIAAHWAGI